MALIRELAPGVFVSGQIHPDDLPDLAAQGVRRIVNNRPDQEEYGQPTAADMQAAAAEVGLGYVHAPIRGMPDARAVADMTAALEGEGPVLLHCKSGMRSTVAWALAMRGSDAMSRDEIVAAGAGAGFDLSSLPF